MKSFIDLFHDVRQSNGWTSKETAEHFAVETNRSVATVYRWLDHCPDTMLELLNIKNGE